MAGIVYLKSSNHAFTDIRAHINRVNKALFVCYRRMCIIIWQCIACNLHCELPCELSCVQDFATRHCRHAFLSGDPYL